MWYIPLMCPVTLKLLKSHEFECLPYHTLTLLLQFILAAARSPCFCLTLEFESVDDWLRPEKLREYLVGEEVEKCSSAGTMWSGGERWDSYCGRNDRGCGEAWRMGEGGEFCGGIDWEAEANLAITGIALDIWFGLKVSWFRWSRNRVAESNES